MNSYKLVSEQHRPYSTYTAQARSITALRQVHLNHTLN